MPKRPAEFDADELPRLCPYPPHSSCALLCDQNSEQSVPDIAASQRPNIAGWNTCSGCKKNLPPYQFAPLKAWSGTSFAPSSRCVACRIRDQIRVGGNGLNGRESGRGLSSEGRDSVLNTYRVAIKSWHECLFNNLGIFVPQQVVAAIMKSLEDHPLLADCRHGNSAHIKSETNGSDREEIRPSQHHGSNNTDVSSRAIVAQPPVRNAAAKATRNVHRLYTKTEDGQGQKQDEKAIRTVKKQLTSVLAEQTKLYDVALAHVTRAGSEHEALRRLHLNQSDIYDVGKWTKVNAVSMEQAQTKIVLDVMRKNFDKVKEIIKGL